MAHDKPRPQASARSEREVPRTEYDVTKMSRNVTFADISETVPLRELNFGMQIA